MTPRWKIRRGWLLSHSSPVWHVYAPGDNIPIASYYLWENAITHVDNWFYDQTLRGA